jgi:hypothetical protein
VETKQYTGKKQEQAEMKTEEICTSETSGSLRTTRRYNPADCIRYSHRCEKLESNIEIKLCGIIIIRDSVVFVPLSF